MTGQSNAIHRLWKFIIRIIYHTIRQGGNIASYIMNYISIYAKYFIFKRYAKSTFRRFNLSLRDIYPCVNDKSSTPDFGEYFYHLAWAARELRAINPPSHYDFSSHVHFACTLSAYIPTYYHEYRLENVNIHGLTTINADLCNLSYPSNSLPSLSCMHVIEHIGLGRYGDTLDYDGDIKAMSELKRCTAVNGDLLFVVPIGNPARIEFNAHRIYKHEDILSFFSDTMVVISFCLIVQRNGKWELNYQPNKDYFIQEQYAVGCYHFKKV